MKEPTTFLEMAFMSFGITFAVMLGAIAAMVLLAVTAKALLYLYGRFEDWRNNR